ncbi:oligosaccharide flippase family protein [Paenibacillus sp. HJGM_3]|uniref:oligosaccharide flippase family protein n=1 Tax=Paenibacillus sp. HJGM_3 TaxID=3379816 RepID=UPI00385B713F
MRLPPFLKQTALRTGAIFLVKLIGIAARIPLFRILGSEGTGIYQIVYSIYGFALTMLTGGIPTSLALMTAKDKERGWHFLKGLILPLTVFGAILALVFYALAPSAAHLLGDGRLAFSIRCVAPALFIVPVLHLFRGYLQGREFHGYIAASELLEQTVRVGTMLLLVVLWVDHGVYAAAGGAVFGAVTGACMALWFLWLILYRKDSFMRTDDRKYKETLRRLFLGSGLLFFFKTSFAITLTRIIVPTSDFLDALIIPNRLQESGLSQSKAISIFGEMNGMASTIVYLPTILTAAISYTIAAKLSRDWQNPNKNDFVRRSRMSLEIGWLWGIGVMMILFFQADELSKLIFGNEAIADPIRLIALSPLLAGMRELTTTILWASDQKKAPLVGLLLGLIVSAIVAYVFTAIPGFGYEGVALSVLALEATSLLWNMAVLQRGHKKVVPVLLLAADFIFLVALGFLFTHLNSLLPQIGIDAEPGFLRSAQEVLLLAGCIAPYLLVRFWRKNR